MVRRLVEACARLARSETVGKEHVSDATSLIEAELESIGAVTVDIPEYDVDIIEGRPSKRELQEERIKTLEGIVGELQEEHDDEPGTPEEKVIDRAADVRIPREKAEHEIQNMRDRAEIYSPSSDHLRLT